MLISGGRGVSAAKGVDAKASTVRPPILAPKWTSGFRILALPQELRAGILGHLDLHDLLPTTRSCRMLFEDGTPMLLKHYMSIGFRRFHQPVWEVVGHDPRTGRPLLLDMLSGTFENIRRSARRLAPTGGGPRFAALLEDSPMAAAVGHRLHTAAKIKDDDARLLEFRDMLASPEADGPADARLLGCTPEVRAELLVAVADCLLSQPCVGQDEVVARIAQATVVLRTEPVVDRLQAARMVALCRDLDARVSGLPLNVELSVAATPDGVLAAMHARPVGQTEGPTALELLPPLLRVRLLENAGRRLNVLTREPGVDAASLHAAVQAYLAAEQADDLIPYRTRVLANNRVILGIRLGLDLEP